MSLRFFICFISICITTSLVFAQSQNDFKLIRLDSIITGQDDTSPFINAKNGDLYFSSKSKSGDLDIYKAKWNSNGWKNPERLPHPINNRLDNEIFHFDTKSQNLYFQKGIVKAKENEIDYGIFRMSFVNGVFGEPIKQQIKYFKNISQDQSFCISEDGEVMIISMQNYSSRGVEDLYVSFSTDPDEWSEPKNLGFAINTKFEEFTPFLDSDNATLFFSSNGHSNGFGSKDIWVSYRQDETWENWSKPVNLGSMVNTYGMETSFRKTGLKEIPFLVVSSRTSNGQSDIFGLYIEENFLDSLVNTIKPQTLEIPVSSDSKNILFPIDSSLSDGLPLKIDTLKIEKDTIARPSESNVNTLILAVFNKESGKSIPATIMFNTKINSDSINLPKDSTFAMKLDWSDTVDLWVNSNEFLPQTRRIVFENKRFGIILKEDFYLDSLEIGKSITFEHVLFKRGTPDLLEESNSDLNNVATILLEHEHLNIEISGHTDNSGNAYLNQLLSEKRANTIKNYLANKGISTERILTVGYGGSKPIASNDSEESMKLNRRVEFRLLEGNK